MRVAVIGASGMIGRAVVGSLTARGTEVVAITRSGTVIGAAAAAKWDGVGPLPEDAVAGCDAVVNLAGSPVAARWTPAVKREIEASRVDLTDRVVAALGGSGPRVLINASAVGYYGHREEEVDEAAAPGSGFLADVSTRWEEAAFRARDRGCRVVTLRTGIVLGNGGALAKMVTPARFGLGGPLGTGRQWFPWIHLTDVVGLVTLALDAPTVDGPLNLVAPGIVRQGAFAKALGGALGRPAVLPTPAFALRLMFGEGALVVLEGQHVVPRVATDAGYVFRFPDVEPALADLV